MPRGGWLQRRLSNWLKKEREREREREREERERDNKDI